MHHRSLSLGIFAAGLLASTIAAQAGNESWVSGTGTDTGTCPRTAPCRTFQFAHDQTTNNGAINVLTSGNFGPLTIDRPISIVAEGVEAVINTGGAAIIIQAGGGAIVSLRGLTIDMRRVSVNNGIVFQSGGALHIQDTVIRGALGNGIAFTPTSGNPELYVSDTVIADGGQQSANVWIAPSGTAGAKVLLDRVRVENATNLNIAFNGGFTTGAITATLRDSTSAGGGIGVFVQEPSGGGSTNVMIDRCAIVNNSTGVSATNDAIIRIGDSTVTGNSLGLSSDSGGQILSYETNKVDGNGTNGAPTGTIAMK